MVTLGVILAFCSAVCLPCHADKVVARQHYDRGLQQYNLGEYAASLEEFLAAYKEYPDPVLLFNLAQCYRQLGNVQKALTLYRSFLRETGGRSPNEEEVKKIVAKLEQDLQKEAERRQPPVIAPVQTPSVAPAVPPVQAQPVVSAPSSQTEGLSSKADRKRPKWVWAVVGGAAVVVVGLGVGLGVGLALKPTVPSTDFGSVTVK